MNKKTKRLSIAIIFIGVSLFCFDFFGARSIVYIKLLPEKKPNGYGIVPNEKKMVEINGLKLSVSTFYAKNPKASVILIHGIRSNKETLYKKAVWLNSNGVNAFCFDLRAHGESEGEYCTYGFYEREDVKILSEIVGEQDSLPLGVWGESLGGAVALQTLACAPEIDFGIIECTFADLNTIIHDYFQRYFIVDFYYPVEYLVGRAESLANFSVDSVKPAECAKHINVPIIVLHGTDDKNINFENGRMIFNNISSSNKYFKPIEGAGHATIWSAHSNTAYAAIETFLNKHVLESGKNL